MPSSCLKRASRFFRPSQLSAAIAGVFFVASPLAWAQLTFINSPDISANAVSGDGRVVTGEMAGGYAKMGLAFRWTADRGAVSLGMLDPDIPGRSYGFSHGDSLNYDGTVIVGSSSVIQNGAHSDIRAFRWTAAGGMQNLGSMGGSKSSWANGVSNDGNVVVGAGLNAVPGLPNSKIEAFRWTAQSGMVGLGYLPGSQDLFSEASAVSGDGLVIVGESNGAKGSEAFRWTQAGGMVGLGDLPGGRFISRASATNLDGSVVVGQSESASGKEAFRWTQGGGMSGLGDLPGGAFESAAFAVSADGKVVVGAGTTDRGLEAFRWTQAGMRPLVDWLSENGVKVAPGYLLQEARSISADGSVIVGSVQHGAAEEAFIARVSSVGSGVITASAVQQTLGAAQTSSEMALRSGATILNGAHSRPLTRRVPEGQKAFWMAGDWGQDDHGARNGDLGLAEVGGGLHLGATQLNVALGHTWAKQVQSLDSRAEINGDYLQADLLIPVTGSLWGVLGAYHHWGAADLRRGYLNAGMPDSSRGNSDAKSWGVRARLEWENALALSSAAFSPYVDLSYGESKMAAYTETGGGFPARFDARTDKSTELRLGLNGSYPVTDCARLVGLFEATHRFEKNSARTSGQLLGLFGFDLAGAELERDWLRAGLGLEGKIGGGSASLMLNATSKGEAPSAWLAASWQMAF